MKLSIIIPVYNVAQYLRQCLDSVLSQHDGFIEVILVDDGSTDDSPLICDEYAQKYSGIQVVHQSNGGLSSARNTGLRIATGDYVLFLDSDDWLADDALSVISRELARNEVDILAFAGQNYDEERRKLQPADVLEEADYKNGYEYYCRFAISQRQFPFECVVLRAYRRKFLIENDLLFTEGIYHEDNLFTPQVCYKAGRVREIGDVLYVYRRRAGSISTSVNMKHSKDVLYIANRLAKETVDLPFADKTVPFQKIMHLYQRPFATASFMDSYRLRSLIDVRMFHRVSRTKLRHRINYLVIRFAPWAFRILYK